MRGLFPIAALIAGVFLPALVRWHGVTPWLLGSMLFLAFLRMEPSDWRIPRSLWRVVLAYLAIPPLLAVSLPWVFPDGSSALVMAAAAPTATAAPGMLAMLGGSPVYGVLAVLITQPLCILPLTPLLHGGWSEILWRIVPSLMLLLALPYAVAAVVRRWFGDLCAKLTSNPALPLLLWNSAVLLASAKVAQDIRELGIAWQTLAIIGGSVGILMLGLFQLGRLLGGLTEAVEASQSLGQKNTLLAIWIAQQWVGPVAALGPMAYVFWQNLYMAIQLHRRKDPRS